MGWRRNKTPTSKYRKLQMANWRKDNKIKKLKLEKKQDAIDHTVEMKDALDTIDDLYEVNGQILTIEEMDDYMIKDNLFDDTEYIQRGLFDLYLDNLLNINAPITNIDQAMDATFNFMIYSMKCSDDDADKLKKLRWSRSKCVKWVAGKVLPFVYYIICLVILLAVPSEGIVILYDGTKREKKDYEGTGFAFNDVLNGNIDISRKWRWGSTEKQSRSNRKKVNLKGFLKDANISRLLVGYERNYGKDAKATKYTIQENMHEIRKYMDILEEPDHKKVIIEEFGEENVNFKDVTERVEGQLTDRHIVK